MLSNFAVVYNQTKKALNFFESIIVSLQKTAERPSIYGWFHILCILLAISLTVILCIFFRKTSEKKFRIIIGICWAVMFIFEIYKQLVFSFDSGSSVWDYQWYSFPFQFCSSPLYVLPLVFLLKDSKVRDGIIVFVSTFSFFAGLAVYVYPGDVFSTDLLGVQIQTMVHHGLQIVLGVYIAVYYREKFCLRKFLYSIMVFLALIIVALTLNVVMHNVTDETFNMFFISPYFDCTLPILGNVKDLMPYIAFLSIYVLGFALCAFLTYLLVKGGIEIIKKISNKSND